MPPTLFLEAFGQLSGPATIDSQEEDLHSVFRERAELMRWATTSNDSPLLWSMEEAEIVADTDPYRIGWVQVGLGVGPLEVLGPPSNPLPGWLELPIRQMSTDPVMALPALVQCFNDSLSPLWSRRVVRSPGDGKWHGDRYRGLPWILGGCAQLV